MATAAYGIFDVSTGRMVFASAGHLPPLVITRAGCALADVRPAAPLGVLSYSTCVEHEVTLATGDLVVLYTDGLVERRGVSIDDGIARLAEAVCDAASPEQVCERAVGEMVPPEGLRDDVAVIALHSEPVPAELHLALFADVDVLHEVRLILRRWLRERGASPTETDDITLAAAEACSNVVKHAHRGRPGPFRLDAFVRDGEVTVAVSDRGQWEEGDGLDAGRGLTIIRAAMDSVDIDSGEIGTTVTMRRRLGAR
jgi:anti-sigma regulatory factor (Ser/Thr protein kinase)